MSVNSRTGLAGFVKVAAWDHDGHLLRSFDDYDVLAGNHLDALAPGGANRTSGTWTGPPVTLKFQLRSAELYSVEFR